MPCDESAAMGAESGRASDLYGSSSSSSSSSSKGSFKKGGIKKRNSKGMSAVQRDSGEEYSRSTVGVQYKYRMSSSGLSTV
jgi:hypothetical protein